jgi:hypothetical protein
MTVAALIAEHGPLVPYPVHILLAAPVRLDGGALAKALRSTIGDVDRLPVTAPNTVSFAYPEHTTDFAERRGAACR